MDSQPTIANAGDHQEQQQSLWITHVSAVGPYLRVCGQLNPVKDLPQLLKESVFPKCEVMYNSWPIVQKKHYLSVGRIYLVKNFNRVTTMGSSELYRVRMLRLIETQPPQTVLLVEVDFIDMGFTKIIECEELLIAPNDNSLVNMPPLGSQYILVGIFADWSPPELEEILRCIANQSVGINVVMEIQGYRFISLKWKDWDFSEFLISQRKIGSPINKDFQRDSFLRILKDHQSDAKNSSNIQNHNNNNINYNNNNTKKHKNFDFNLKQNSINTPSSLEEATAMKQKIQQQQQYFLQQHLLRQKMQQTYPPEIILPSRPLLGSGVNYITGIHQRNNRMPYTGQTVLNPMVAPFTAMRKSFVPTGMHLQRPMAIPTIPAIMPNSPINNSNANSKSGKSLPNTGYKINKFIVGNTYDVCVSFVEKGPYLFSVQLISSQDRLTEMMNKIENIRLQNLTDKLTVGMACIARYSEDGQLYRALVANVNGSDIQVVYIDYGNSEIVKKSDLYEIPSDFLEERAFALRFALSGLKTLGPIDDSLKKTFKEMVVYKACKLTVTPPEGPPVVQYCELYMQEKNLLNLLQDVQKSRLVYPKASQLVNNDVVEIRFIDSPRNFYVQNIANISDFEKLMDDMFLYYNSNQTVPQHIAVGAAYAVKTDTDWYRAEVIKADEQAIIVRLVDFGYERTVTKNLLSTISEKHLKMPRQAVHCCLKGFESNKLNNKDLATTQFEMLAEDSNGPRRSFNVKVFRIQPDDLHIVNLFTKELNVMKKLYKLSMPFEQYLTLEKEDFHMNGFAINNNGNANQPKRKTKDENTKAYSTSSSNVGDEQSSHQSKRSSNENANPIKLNPAAPAEFHQQKQQKKPNLSKEIPQQIFTSSTPAQRLQQYSSKNLNKSTDWEQTSSASSNNARDVLSNTSDRQKITQQHKYQQNQQHNHNQQHNGRKHNNQLNTSLESTDRRSDASTSSNRSRMNNVQRQKDRRHNKDATTTQKPPRLQKQQHERSQNAPQGYSQSRRGSMDSQYGVEISVTTTAPPLIPTKPEEYMPLDSRFPHDDIEVPKIETVTICWWISPHQFYTHRTSRLSAFTEFMSEIQSFYKKKKLEKLQLKPESYVIARHRKDNMFYRARITACNHMLRKYKVNFVDFGSQYMVTSEDIWPVERRFADFPIMAYYCSLSNIVSNYDHLYIIDRMDKYLPNGATLICDYKERVKNLHYVDVKVNNVSLTERLKADGFITEISPDISVELLAGQQIRAKIVSIKNMLNFKILLEGCDVPLLCSYDDVRFVKSNPDIVHKFKEFYEGKSCMVYIKDVNDNKVVLLRPLLPLFRDETSIYICNLPRIWNSFEGSVVFISSAHRLFIHPQSINKKIEKLLDDMYEYYEKQGSPLSSFEIGKICAVKSVADSNWYRARILKPNKGTLKENTYEAYYIDYGNTEILEKTQFKILEEQFYVGQSAYAVEINLPLRLVAAKSPTKKSDELNATVMEQLRILLEEQAVKIQPVECRRNHLIAEVIIEQGQNILDILIAKKLVKGRDLDYMCKQLENDKSGVFEFIETVDLTLDDEDDTNTGKRPELKSQKVSSPRKKKGNNNSHNASTSSKSGSEKVTTEITKVVVPEVSVNKTQEPVSNVSTELVSNLDPTPDPVSVVAQEPSVHKPEVVQETAIVTPVEPVTNVDDVELKAEMVDSSVTNVDDVELKEEMVDSAVPSVADSPLPSYSPDDYTDMDQAVLSHCDTPAQFFVHPHDKIDQLRKLQENLQIVASSFPPLMNVSNGAYCISMYSVDKQWYRAQIIDAELMAIKFIDFGNTDCVSDTTDVKEMSVFPDIEPLCIPCALPIRPNGTADWVDAANAIFNESYSKTLYFNYITHGDYKKPSYINLFIEGVNVAKKLIDDGFAKPLELVNSGVNCYISHVNSITDFYIQYERNAKALELFEIYFSDISKLDKIKEFTKDKIVAALFHDDGNWYRAKLLKQLAGDEGFEVLFIDYGNTATTKECLEISVEVGQLPPLSKRCSLDISQEDYLGWSDAAEEKFAEIAASGETVFTVELRAPSVDRAIVYLYIDNLNINSELEQLCVRRNPDESKVSDLNSSFGVQSVATIDTSDSSQIHNVVISHVKSPECFFVQFGKDSSRLEDLTNTLNVSVGMDTVKEDVKIGQLYATTYDEDNKLYRARVLKINDLKGVVTYTVLFVDFGNEAVVQELRLLPHDLEEMREMCRRCALKGINVLNAQSDVDTVAKIFNEIVDSSKGNVKLDFEQPQPENGAALVNLYTPTTNESFYEQILAKIQEKNQAKMYSNQCLISHAVTPFELYIQFQNNLEKLEHINLLLRESFKTGLPKLTTEAKINELYAVLSDEFGGYHRGRLVAVYETPNKYEVKVIDHGETMRTSELFELPAELRDETELAVRCRLSGLTTEYESNQSKYCEYLTCLVDAHFGELFDVDVVTEPSSVDNELEVKLKIEGEDLATILSKSVKDGSVPQTVVKPILHDCAIVQINSTASFYVHLLVNTPAIEKITDILLDAEEQFSIFSDIKIGALCAAQYPDDGVFYRARIVEIVEEGNKDDNVNPKCLVHFIDFGNDSITDQFRKLPEEILEQPSYSKHCALGTKFKDEETATKCLKTYIEENYSETFQIEFINEKQDVELSEQPVLCRLFHQTKNVANEIQTSLKNA